MRCNHCESQAVFSADYTACKEHFIQLFEEKAAASIERFQLLRKDEKIAVAASGGKDSTTLLYLLRKFGYHVTAVAVDEGIEPYRSSTLRDLQQFCSSHDIPLQLHSYKESFGFTLDEGLQALSISSCKACGILRRYALNKAAKAFDKLATGHNLDDEAQSILMNMAKGNTAVLARLGPKTGQLQEAKFVPRVKPLYFCSEKEVATYAVLQRFAITFTQCPNSGSSIRSRMRDALNDYEAKHPGSKLALVENFLQLLPSLQRADKAIRYCRSCSEPAAGDECNACKTSGLFSAALLSARAQ